MGGDAAPLPQDSENAVPPRTNPHIILTLTLHNKLTADSDCYILVTLRRSASDEKAENESATRPCIIYWDAVRELFSASGLQLFNSDTDGNAPKGIKIHSLQYRGPDGPFTPRKNEAGLYELAPGAEQKIVVMLPPRYRSLLAVVGACYELVWPGDQIYRWAWGTIAEHAGKEMLRVEPSLHLSSARLMVRVAPAPTVEEVRAEKRAESPKPFGEGDRIPDTPVLRLVLDCDSKTVELASLALDVQCSLAYNAEPGSRPITFRRPFLWGAMRLYRRHGDDWDGIEDERSLGFLFLDDEPKQEEISVGRDDEFISLWPGGKWTTVDDNIRRDGLMQDDVARGQVYKYGSKGFKVDWWDWGSKEEHVETKVKTCDYGGGRVIKEPGADDLRRKLVVPQSNFVEFTVM